MDYYDGNSFEELSVIEEKKRSGKKTLIKKICALCLCSAIIGGFAGAALYKRAANSRQDGAEVKYYTQAVSGSVSQLASAGGTLTPAEIYSKNINNVVAVSTESATMNIFGQVSNSASSGTGFIISSDGYILTCYHVIEGAETVKVSTYDGKQYTAKVTGYDDENDLAVLKIEASGLSYALIGDSGELVVGESVYTIGNPLGEYTYTMTSGIVSALDREINIDGDSINMFQLDAAVNSGNSGGPVFNSDGEVIGMVTAKTAMSGVEGIGFAMPIGDLTEAVNQIIENGYVSGRPYIGISVQNVTKNMRIQNGTTFINGTDGVYVISVESGSCAAQAGIKAGDIITGIDGTEITSYSGLQAAKKLYSAGDTAAFNIYRNGSTVTLKVVFDEKKPSSAQSADTVISRNYGRK